MFDHSNLEAVTCCDNVTQRGCKVGCFDQGVSSKASNNIPGLLYHINLNVECSNAIHGSTKQFWAVPFEALPFWDTQKKFDLILIIFGINFNMFIYSNKDSWSHKRKAFNRLGGINISLISIFVIFCPAVFLFWASDISIFRLIKSESCCKPILPWPLQSSCKLGLQLNSVLGLAKTWTSNFKLN